MARHVYPAGGWLPEHAPLVFERDDQGKDFVTRWRGAIQAPGAGFVVAIHADAPFPDGFGPHYPQVRIETGRFRGHDFYLGHTTAVAPEGARFSFGRVLSHADQGRPSQLRIVVPGDGGWVELGEWFASGPGPNEPSHWFDALLRTNLVITTSDPPLRYGDHGMRVLGMSSRLRDCGYLTRPWWHFNRQVHGAVVAFKHHHKIRVGHPDGGVVDHKTDVALTHAAQWCRRHHHHEV